MPHWNGSASPSPHSRYAPANWRSRASIPRSSIAAAGKCWSAAPPRCRAHFGAGKGGAGGSALLSAAPLPLLDVYGLADMAEEKNRLLKALLQKVVYHKTRRTRQKGGSDLTLTLYPRFPAR